jgi:hypothetical protein
VKSEAKKKPEAKKRARKTSAVPTRIYSGRCLPPVTEIQRVEDQFRLGAQYRNALVEIEHRLRDRIREVQLEHPIIGPATLAFERAQADVDGAYDELRAAKSGTADPDLTAPRERLATAKKLRLVAVDALRASKRPSALLIAANKAAAKLTKMHAPADSEGGQAPTSVREDLGLQEITEAEITQAAIALADAEAAAKIATPEDEKLLAAYTMVREEAHAKRKAARTDYSGRGLRHGTYIRVELAVQQAASSSKRALAFERYDGSGSIGHQLLARGSKKGDKGKAKVFGLTLQELISQKDTRLRLGPPGALDPHPRVEVAACASWDEAMKLGRNLRRHAARTWVDLRVGSNPDRSPIFARFPVTLHRLPPRDAVIKWAYVVRKRVGNCLEWRFQLTLESKTFEGSPIPIGEDTCAVNLGWRRIVDDQGKVIGLRAAYVVDSLGKEREIRVPDYVTSRGAGKNRRARGNHKKQTLPLLAAIGKCDDLAHIRDQALERAQLALSTWLSERGGVPSEWEVVEKAHNAGQQAPRPMADRLRGYSAWRAAWKLRRFVDAWKTRRVPGDEATFDALTAWAKQDRHLETWQVAARERLIARRREAWRVIATELARRYATILVGESRLPEIDGWEKKAPEDGDPSEGREQRRMSRIAAPGELRAEIVKAAHKTGAAVKLRGEVRATQTCADCGHDEPWDAAPSILHTCGGCGRTWDQDANYCRNLLGRGDGASGDDPRIVDGPLATGTASKERGNSGSASNAVLARASD